MKKYCKVICTHFGHRHLRSSTEGNRRGIGWPRHGQYAKDANMSLDNLKFVVDIENNLNSGVHHDTIIVNNDSGFVEGNDWLDSINGCETKNGKIFVIHRENKGRHFAAFRHVYEKYKDDYDYFMFIPDDHIIIALDYYKKALDQYLYDIENHNSACLALGGTGESEVMEGGFVCAHDGMILIHKKFIEEGIEKFGQLPSADDGINYVSEDPKRNPLLVDVIYEHVEHGEIPFTNRYNLLGYNIIPFGYLHSYPNMAKELDGWSYDGNIVRRPTTAPGGWPIKSENQIFIAPIFNLLFNDPNKINIDDYDIDESILPVLKKQEEICYGLSV